MLVSHQVYITCETKATFTLQILMHNSDSLLNPIFCLAVHITSLNVSCLWIAVRTAHAPEVTRMRN